MTNFKKVLRGRERRSDYLQSLKITNKMVSEWFEYSTPNSFVNSYRRNIVLKGVERAIRYAIKTVSADNNSNDSKSLTLNADK